MGTVSLIKALFFDDAGTCFLNFKIILILYVFIVVSHYKQHFYSFVVGMYYLSIVDD